MFCTNCGNNCLDNVAFCNKCGKPLNNNHSVQPQAFANGASSANKTPIIVGIVVGGLVLLGLVVALIVYLVTSSSNNSFGPAPQKSFANTLVDNRDGQVYKTVQIGRQIWMAENLNYYMSSSWCMSGGNCKRTGRLYTWYAATEACPYGWHLPSKYEYQELWSAVGGEWIAGKALKARSGWGYGEEGSDSFGFAAYPAGYIGATGAHNHGSDRADFWTSSAYDDKAYDMDLYGEKNSAALAPDAKSYGFSVRCVKN